MSIEKEQIIEWFNEKRFPIKTESLANLMEQCFNDLSPKWISIDGYKNLPIGIWLVKIEGEEVPMVADNTKTICVIGGRFAFDHEMVVSYMPLPEANK